MASTINIANIDENYPVAGQDNDSQGFRDNFQNIKTALGIAKSEITGLQDNTVDITNADTSFSGNTISDVVLRDEKTAAPSAFTITTTTSDVDLSTGSYVRLILNVEPVDGNNVINFINWGPANTMQKVRLEIVPNNEQSKVVQFAPSNLWKKQDTPGSANALTNPITINSANEWVSGSGVYVVNDIVKVTGVGQYICIQDVSSSTTAPNADASNWRAYDSKYIFDVWSADQGTNVFVSYEGKYVK